MKILKPGSIALKHFTTGRLGRVVTCEQSPPSFKPNGLWLSVGDAWRDWCVGEEWNVDGLRRSYDIQLHPDANILHLSATADIDAFHDEFHRPPSGLTSGYFIDWRAVAERHQGIVIAPYVWQRRLHPRTVWYYGWDCASGCIWDAAAVLEVAETGRGGAI